MKLGRIGLISKPEREEIPGLLSYVASWCNKRGIDLVMDATSAAYLDREGAVERERVPEECDMIVVLGGDGTLLSAARAVGQRQTPLLAVNLGGLGFMMTTGPDELPSALDEVEGDSYQLDRRMVLEGRLVRAGEELDRYFALNDIVVTNGAVARLLHLEAFANDEYVCGYRSDGLILSTPTGSTAYSLAAGGPVMSPGVQAMSLTPIAPHSLSNRPVVLPASSTIEIAIAGGDSRNYLSIDGQVGRPLEPDDRIFASKAGHTVDIVQTTSRGYFDILRSKMAWGDL